MNTQLAIHWLKSNAFPSFQRALESTLDNRRTWHSGLQMQNPSRARRQEEQSFAYQFLRELESFASKLGLLSSLSLSLAV